MRNIITLPPRRPRAAPVALSEIGRIDTAKKSERIFFRNLTPCCDGGEGGCLAATSGHDMKQHETLAVRVPPPFPPLERDQVRDGAGSLPIAFNGGSSLLFNQRCIQRDSEARLKVFALSRADKVKAPR